MFTPNAIIDSITTAKKQAIKAFVQHETIAKSLTELVDAEAAMNKSAIKASTDAFTSIGQEVVRASKDAADKLASGEYFKDMAKSAK